MTTAATHDVFANSWFARQQAGWRQVLSDLSPPHILKVGSYEGSSTTDLIETIASQKDVEIHDIDSWEGGVEHKPGGFQ